MTDMEMIKEELQKHGLSLADISKELFGLTITLLGNPDTKDSGLYGMVLSHKEQIDEIYKRINKINRTLWLLIGASAGSGLIGASLTRLFGG